MRYLLLFALVCSIGCTVGKPGRTLVLDGKKEAVTLGKTTRYAVPLNDIGDVVVDKGARLRFALGNKGAAAATVAFEGLSLDSMVLEPGRWTTVDASAKGQAMVMRSDAAASIMVAEPYQAPVGKTNPPNILLISIDTLRYDHFNPDHMPRLYALFKQGKIFNRAMTTAPWTLPAHVSMLAGSYPATHGVRRPDDRIPASAFLLAEAMRDGGYYNLAVTEANYVSAIFGFARGFHEFYEDGPMMLDADPAKLSRLAANLDFAEQRLATLENEPTFLFLHTYEVHCPYLPRDGRTDPEGLGDTQWLLDNDGKDLNEETYARLKDLYAGETTYVDGLLAPFAEKLLARGNWIVMLVSDHGEEFGEHGGLLHADTLYEEALHIPLAIAGKGVSAGASDELCSLIDVPTTITGLAGLAPNASWQGRDLLAQGFVARNWVFAESFFFGPQIAAEDPRLAGIREVSRKLIQTRNHDAFNAELYDLTADPREHENVQAERAAERDALFLVLEAYLSGESLAGEKIEEMSPEQIEVLRTLGYVK